MFSTSRRISYQFRRMWRHLQAKLFADYDTDPTTNLHGVKTRKKNIVTLTAVKTSNLKQIIVARSTKMCPSLSTTLWRHEDKAPRILDLGTRRSKYACLRLHSCTCQPSPRYPPDWRPNEDAASLDKAVVTIKRLFLVGTKPRSSRTQAKSDDCHRKTKIRCNKNLPRYQFVHYKFHADSPSSHGITLYILYSVDEQSIRAHSLNITVAIYFV